MNPALRLALLALPLAGLGWVWYDTATRNAQGIEWDVPVTGYDPRDLLKPYAAEQMELWPVSSRVNNVRNEDADLLVPVAV